MSESTVNVEPEAAVPLTSEASAAEAAASSSSSSSSSAAAAAFAAAPASNKKGKKGKKAVSAAAATAAAAGKEEEESANNLATVDHPYLSFLHKRIRSYKKKLEKIKGLELARATDGKVLNTQQLELVASKTGLEKLIVEFETLREQFIEVYLQEEAAKKAAEEDKAAALIDVVLEATAPEAEIAPEPQQVEGPRDEFEHVGELLKALHAVTLHQALGEDVPMVLDFFSKVLLGNTRPPAEVSYSENLAESLEQAKKFLASSDELFACDTTYAGLRQLVHQLDQSASEPVAEAVEVEEEAPVVEEPVNELPQINFFTDSQLEPEDSAQDDASADAQAVVADTDRESFVMEVTVETITIEETVELEPVAPARVIVEPPPSALPMPSAPKSFAAATSGGSLSPSGSNRSASPTADGSGDARGKSGSQRRRGAPRWKKESSNSSSSNSKGDGSDGAKNTKPRRPRPSRATDESGADKSASRGAKDKDKDRRPRAELAFRKPSAQPAPLAPNA